MRSPSEIAFRLRQESANLYLLFKQPHYLGGAPERLSLPDPKAVVDALRGSEFAAAVLAIGNNVMAHRFPLLGVTLETGPEIEWRRDYAHGKTSGTQYFRRIRYLSFADVGDHKFIWELNRHQHLVALAQAYLFTGDEQYTREVFSQLESWLAQNPFQRGINWASALEVAFRALSWIWLWHFIAPQMPPDLRRRFLTALRQHGLHLAENLSVYFSPNTHLLGEGVALHALGLLFTGFPEAEAWRRRGARVVESQLEFQVKPDGSHFEQSTYYHVYALDLFLFHYLLAGRPEKFDAVLARMADYLDWLLGPARRITFFGDDDGGRFFHPYGERDGFGRATLTTCGIVLNEERWIGPREDIARQAAWWLGADCLQRAHAERKKPAGSRAFVDCGTVFLQSDDLFVQFDAGPFAWGGAGHSHADTLSLVVWFQGEAVFLDPGTFTYIGDPKQRDWFRGTAVHNTVCIDRLDQAQTVGPFRWAQKPAVTLSAFSTNDEGGFADAVCLYKGLTHRRRVLLRGGQLLVLDDLSGPDGEHECRQSWTLGPAAARVHLSFSCPVTDSRCEISPVYGCKMPGTARIARTSGRLPLSLEMRLNTAAESTDRIEC